MDESRRKAVAGILWASAGLVAAVAGATALSLLPLGGRTVNRSSPSGPSLSTSYHEISVQVAYYGMPLDVTSTKEETVELIVPAYLSDLENLLVNLHPALKGMLNSMMFQVDEVTVTGNPQLSDNSVVNVISVAAGG